MKAVIALAVSISLLGCFPNNARHRRYAQWAEGGALVAGIAIAAVANTGADCDQGQMVGMSDTDCKNEAKWLSTTGVVLILAGLLGFVATVSTAEDDAASTPRVLSVEKKEPTQAEPAKDPAATGTGTTQDPAGTGQGTTVPETTPPSSIPTEGSGSAAPAPTP